jgi:hypothetical protein
VAWPCACGAVLHCAGALTCARPTIHTHAPTPRAQGFDLAITPHLDDGLELGGWRNALVFDPLAKYGGYSYYEIMLKPIASALSAVITAQTQVWFAMQGAW